MAQTDSGVYDWVRDALGPLGNGKIPASPTWKVYLIANGGYNPSFASHEAFSVIGAGAIVASQPVTPPVFSGGKSIISGVTFLLLTGAAVGSVALTVSGTIERLYAHWGRADAGLPFTPNGTTKVLNNLVLQHRRLVLT